MKDSHSLYIDIYDIDSSLSSMLLKTKTGEIQSKVSIKLFEFNGSMIFIYNYFELSAIKDIYYFIYILRVKSAFFWKYIEVEFVRLH